ncbi:uncharacterized protein LOC62_04G005342 [Vanrija pseudolonga]|uniref:Uncharacterized protein n=1 Tax=Vanrija pseudolonga TaxID=143232 RepID=A0AAF1BMA0_9TREE|nr:hypothetical protein LOC62_04G005342 [Vanrija pseudolonga]
MTAIDHTSYPAIIDLVLSYASPQVLLAFRSTSKALQRRVDAPFAHVVLKPQVVGPARKGVQSASIPMVLSTPSSPPLPLPWFPFAVGVLDHWGDRSLQLRRLEHTPRLHTLRRFNHAVLVDTVGAQQPGLTLVDFINVTEWEWLASIQMPRPPGTTRSVMHLKYDGSMENVLFTQIMVMDSADWEHSLEFVFVLWPTDDPNEDKPAAGRLEFLYSAILSSLAGWDGQDITITVVGMEDADEKEHRDADPDALWDHIPREMAYLWEDDDGDYDGTYSMAAVSDPLLNAAARRVTRFLTREEWWNELGDKKEIEGVWPAEASFPGIVDQILSHASPKTQLALRKTSKEFKLRVDAQFKHVALQPRTKADDDALDDESDDDEWLDTPAPSLLLTMPTTPPRSLPWLPCAIQVLDLYGHPLAESDPGRRQLLHVTRLHTLRRFQTSFTHKVGNPPPGTTIVDFVEVAQWSRNTAISVVIPKGTSRFVMHLRYDESVQNDIFTEMDVFCVVPVRDRVFVLWPSTAGGDKHEPAFGKLGLLHHAILSSLRKWEGEDLSITVVGMEAAAHVNGSPDELVTLDEGMRAAARRATRFITREKCPPGL